MAVKDTYANKFYATVVESAANTLTFSEIKTNVNVFSKTAWVLHRLEYSWPRATMQLVVATVDAIEMALTSSDNLSDLSLSSPGVIDKMEKSYTAYGTPANAMLVENPILRDFTQMPGKGLIIAPRPLFLAVLGADLTGPATVEVRGYFTVIDLKAEEYLELVDFYRIVQ